MRVLVAVAAGCMLLGCTQTVETRDALWEAKKALEAGRNEEAMLRLQSFLAAGRDGPRREEAAYLLGVAYYRMGATEKAGEAIAEYLQQYPGGRFADDAVAVLKAVNAKAASDRQKRLAAEERMKRRLAEAEAAAEARPQDPQARVRLADAYFAARKYADAVSAYRAAESMGYDFQADAGASARFAQARFEVARERTQAELSGLVVSDVSHKVRHTPRGRSLASYVVVTGKVTNQTPRTFRDVRVNVALYGTQMDLIDAANAHIGTLRPGQTRAFSVRIDDIGSTGVFEIVCTPTAD